MSALFLPGWGARASLYRTAVPAGWEVLEPPSFRATGGSLGAYSTWLADELGRRTGPFTLGGHSFGAALTVLAAARGEVEVERLVLVDPAGLPALEADAPLPPRLRPAARDRRLPGGAGSAERRLVSGRAARGAQARPLPSTRSTSAPSSPSSGPAGCR